MNKTYPDFIIIGAQKSGTTSLFEILRSHASIYMPPEKELQFFNHTERFKHGLLEYMKNFEASKEGQLRGEASPQYMGNKCAATRINSLCSNVKLIAILRNPIERAYSHYQMTLRRGRIKLDFAQAIRARMTAPYGSPEEPNMDHDFLLLGEYARILSWFTPYFERNMIKVVLLDDLTNNSHNISQEIAKYLCISSSGFRKTNAHAHKGGSCRSRKLDYYIRNNSYIKLAAKAILSPKQRNAALFWFDTKINVKPKPSSATDIDTRLYNDLQTYFHSDIKALEKLLKRQIPWI